MKSSTKKTCLALFLTLPLVLSGCGLLHKGQEKSSVHPPPEQVTTDKGGQTKQTAETDKTEKADAEKADQTVQRQLYLIDSKNHVAPVGMKMPASDSAAKQVIEYLVSGGPVTDMLPNGFKAVLPQGTEVKSINLSEDKTLTVDFSKEFLDYKPEMETKMLEALTWTATQFNTVDQVKIRVDGKPVSKMPKTETDVSAGLSRDQGINEVSSSVVDLAASDQLTVYYMSQNNNGDFYYVPVTKRVASTDDKVDAAVSALVSGTDEEGLTSPFNEDVALLDKPMIEDGVVTLNFNDHFYENSKKHTVSDEAVAALVLSLTQQKGIEKVALKVDGKSDIQEVSGKALSKPVGAVDLKQKAADGV